MMKMNEGRFVKTELGSSMVECAVAWDKALDVMQVRKYDTDEYKRAKKTSEWCQAQWEVYKMAVQQFFGIEYHFSRTDEYVGICTEDETSWLFKNMKEVQG